MTALAEPLSRSRVRIVLAACVIVTLTILAYLPALQGGFIWDDDRYVTENPLLIAPDGLSRIWFSTDSPSQYFPLTYTSFRIEHALWGLRPFGYHLTNLLLHVANALLLWRLLVRLKIPGAWLAAGIFALHPVQVESVAWVAERKNVLMAFFFLLTLLSWVEFLADEARKRLRYYGLALLFYALALASKTTACTMPAALFLILWLQERSINWKRISQIVPFVLLGGLMGFLTMWWERHHQGTGGSEFGIGIPERVLIASRGVWFYAGKLFWPAKLTFIYPRWNLSPGNPFSYIWLVALVVAGAAIYFSRKRLGRGPEVGVAFFITTLSPLLGLVMLYTFRYKFVSDHYQYVASIGLIALFAAAWTRLSVRAAVNRYLESGTAVVLFLVLGALTWRQAGIYQNLETIWMDTLQKNPTSWLAHDNLGVELLRERKVDEALEHSLEATRLKPNYAPAEGNLGNVYFQKGLLDEAEVHFRRALAIDPTYVLARNNLGNLLSRQGEYDEAINHFLKAIELNPDQAAMYNNLAITYRKAGKPEEAIRQYEKALALRPDYAEAHQNLANVLLQLGRRDEAIAHLKEALRIKPDLAPAQRALQKVLAEPK